MSRRRIPQHRFGWRRRAHTLALALAALIAILGAGSGLAAAGSSVNPLSITAAPATAPPGAKVAVAARLDNSSGTQEAARLTVDVPPGSSFVGPAQGPSGWPLEYSVDGGATWGTAPPADAAAVTNVRSAGQLPAEAAATAGLNPMSPVGAVQVSGAGDGFNVQFASTRIWTANHHERPGKGTWLRCFDRVSGQPCAAPFPAAGHAYIAAAPGTPFGQGADEFGTPNSAVAFVNQSKERIYVPVQRGGTSGPQSVGWLCGDLAAMVSCGFIEAGQEQPAQDLTVAAYFPSFNAAEPWHPTDAGALLYAAGRSGKVYCLDAATGTLCPDNARAALATGLDASITTFPFVTAAATSSSADHPSYIWTTVSPNPRTGILQCVDPSSGASCFGAPSLTLPNPFPAAAAVSYSQAVPMYSTTGALEAACVLAQELYQPSVWLCYDPAGARQASWEARLKAVTPGDSAHFGARVMYPLAGGGNLEPWSLMTLSKQLGSKVYLPWVTYPKASADPYGDGVNSVGCFDFATSAACAGYSAAQRPYPENMIYTVEQSDVNPDCLWWLGNVGRLQAFSGSTGALGCQPLSQTELVVQPQSCVPLDGVHYTSLRVQGLPAGVTATVVIRAADGSILPQGAGVTLTNGSVVDLSSLPVGGATSKLTATLTATGAALADLGGATVSIGWDAHFAALCLGIVPKADCTAAVALRIPAHAVLAPAGATPVTTEATAGVSVPRAEADCRLALAKTINGQAVADPPGVELPAGSAVHYGFTVSTPGAFTLGKPDVTDDRATPDDTGDDFHPAYVGGDTNGNGLLDPGETWRYQHDTTAAATGPVINTATATAPGASNNPVRDKAAYTPQPPAIGIVKKINGAGTFTADGAPHRVQVVPGAATKVTFEVTNTGATALGGVAVVDAPLNDGDAVLQVTCPRDSLQPGESMLCTAEGVGVVGEHDDEATTKGNPIGPDGRPLVGPDGKPLPPVTASSKAGYQAQPDALGLAKKTNGRPGIVDLARDMPVTWTYVVTNNGPRRITDIVVTDDKEPKVTCPEPAALDPGASMECTAQGTAEVADYRNRAAASGRNPDGKPVSSPQVEGGYRIPAPSPSGSPSASPSTPSGSPSASPSTPSPSPTVTFTPTPTPTPAATPAAAAPNPPAPSAAAPQAPVAQGEPPATATQQPPSQPVPAKAEGSLAQTGGGSIVAFVLLGLVALVLGAGLRSAGRR